jgi:hypothetical protein
VRHVGNRDDHSPATALAAFAPDRVVEIACVLAVDRDEVDSRRSSRPGDRVLRDAAPEASASAVDGSGEFVRQAV